MAKDKNLNYETSPEEKVFNLWKKILSWSAMSIIGLILFWSSIYIVDEGERAVITRFGSVNSISDPGFNLKLPFVDTVHRYNMRVQKAVFGAELGYEHNEDFDNAPYTKDPILSAYSHDRQLITSYRISITYTYPSDKIEDVYKFFGTEDSILSTVVYPHVQQISKNIFGRYTAETIVHNRTDLENDISNELSAGLKKYPINIVSIQLEDINFSKKYEEVLENTAKKAQEIETAKAELQRIEIESKQKIAQADAENQAIKLKADADAYQIKVKAQAEADAIKLKAEALRNNKEIIDLTVVEKWKGEVPQTVVGDSKMIPFINVSK